MNFSSTEIILLTLQILLLPFAKYFFAQYRKETTNEVLMVLNEHYVGLSNLIENNKEKLEKFETKMEYRIELSKIKFKELNNRLKDIENFLKKHNFQPRNMYEEDETEKPYDYDSGFF
jgi:uncharacterized protein YpuA (DUF1002 family)